MSLSDYAENALLNSLFGKTSALGALGSAPTLYAALFTAAPNDAGGGTEADYTSYARVSTSAGDWNAAASGTIDNANAITFPQSTGGSNTVTHVGLFDASSSGNLIAWGALSASRDIASGDTPEFAAGAFDVSLD